MNSIDPNVLIEISKTVAAIDERTKAAEKQADHRHGGIMQAIQNFVPRREIEAEHASIRKYAEQLATDTRTHCDGNREAVLHRVDGIEKTIKDFTDGWSKIKWALLFAAGSGIVSGLGYVGHLLLTVKLAVNP